ncbi:DNA cytosine methyltransferase [Pseudarthrobacter sulfonivorans]
MKYVDLFSGCGGLSLGIERAGGELLLAVEKSDMAARTFYHNFREPMSDIRRWEAYVDQPLELQAKRGVAVSELNGILENEGLMEFFAAEELDLVVGGPPCQGFSLAGRRNPEDIRNKLPWEYLSFVERTRPKAVVIENVVGMSHRFSSDEDSAFSQLQQALRETTPGYEVQGVAVNAVHYGAPQNRPRLMIIGLRQDVADRMSIRSTGSLWRSSFLCSPEAATKPPLAPAPIVDKSNAPTIADAIADLQSVLPQVNTERSRIFREQVRAKTLWGLPPAPPSQDHPGNQSPRKHAVRTQDRFRLYQWMRDNSVPPRILSDIARGLSTDEVIKIVRGKNYPAVAPDGTVIARDEAGMSRELSRLSTKKHSQKALHWDAQAPTVVTLPDDYVHPSVPRIFTVRELARFQGFPDDFEFQGKETTGSTRRRFEVPQYSQVGNAVSPFLSHAVGKMIAGILGADGRN